jgi:WD40 repeat protein
MTADMPLHQDDSSSDSLDLCPYRGLIPYSESDARYFFGREKWSHIILDNLLATQLTLLYGSSGVGKSSVLGAGVASRLKAKAKDSVARSGIAEHLVVVCRDWRDNPLSTLKTLIREEMDELLGRRLAESCEGKTTLSRLLNDCSVVLTQADVNATGSRGTILLILDQFEEYFLYHPNEDEQGGFAKEFPQAVNDSSLPLHVLISLREDSLAKLDCFKSQLPNIFDNRLRIEHLDRDAAVDAILKPIQESNRQLPDGSTKASVEPQLVQEVLEQVRVGQISELPFNSSKQSTGQAHGIESLQVEAPFLQLVMTRLWEEEIQTAFPPRLRQSTLARLGGGATIVREHLQRLMQHLPDSSKRIAAVIFDKLVTSGLTKIAYPVFELTDSSKVDPQGNVLNREDLKRLLDYLSGGNQRILRRLPPSIEHPNAEDRYEIYHDVLAKPILEWKRTYTLEQQLNQERQQHAQELEVERRRRTKMRQRSLGLAGILGGIIVVLSAYTFSLMVKEKELNVIESAQDFNVQQLEQIDVLVKALSSAHWLQETGQHSTLKWGGDIGASLRHILDNIQEQFKVTFLLPGRGPEDRNWLAKLRLDAGPPQSPNDRIPKGDVVLLLRGQTLARFDLKGQLKPFSGPLASTGGIVAFALADTGGRIATVSQNSTGASTVQLWNRKGEELWRSKEALTGYLPKAPFMVRNRLAVASNGSMVATVSSGQILRIIELDASPLAGQVKSYEERIPNLALVRFSPDNNLLAAVDRDGKIHILNTRTKRRIGPPLTIPSSTGFIFGLEFTSDGKRIAISSKDGYVRIYDLSTRSLREFDAGRVFQMRFNGDGSRLAIGSRDGVVRILNLSVMSKPSRLGTAYLQQTEPKFINPAAVYDLRFSNNDDQLITLTAAGTLHVWAVPAMAKIISYRPEQQLSVLAVDRHTESVAWNMVGSESAICQLPLAKALPDQRLMSPLPDVPCTLSLIREKNSRSTDLSRFPRLQFSTDGRYLAALDWDANGALWDLATQGISTLNLPLDATTQPPFSAISFSTDGNRLAFVARGGAQGVLLVCDQRNRKNQSIDCDHVSVVKQAWSDGFSGFWPDLLQGHSARKKSASLDLTGVRFFNTVSGHSSALIVSIADGHLCFGNFQSNKRLVVAKCQDAPSGQGELAVSRDDTRIGLAGTDGKLHLWIRDGSEYRKARSSPIQVSAGPLMGLSFQPYLLQHKYQSKLAAIALDGTASVWDMKGQHLANFQQGIGRRGGYLGAIFRTDDELLLWTFNGYLRQVSVENLDQLIARGCQWLHDYRVGPRTPKDVNKSLAFCDKLS